MLEVHQPYCYTIITAIVIIIISTIISLLLLLPSETEAAERFCNYGPAPAYNGQGI